jgi:SAM-dependent methyltransferase/uncharacterized protein YbaR (Trm112 family)
MLPLLWDEKFPLICTSIDVDDRGDRTSRCGTPLLQRDDLTLVCTNPRCVTEYRVDDGIPVLLAPSQSVPAADYNDELIAQMYAEMHFATFRTEVPERVRSTADAADPTDLGRKLLALDDLTGPFYSTMSDIVLSNLPSDHGLIADVACGMARMAFEFQTHGWHGDYLGIDLSPRLLDEARRAFSGEEIPVRVAAEFGVSPRSSIISIQAPKISSERSLLAVGDAARLALASASCDAVLGLNLIDRVEDPAATVKELWRCVAPGGILVLADPFQWQDQAPANRVYSFDAVGAWLDGAEAIDLPEHQRSVVFAMHRRASREVVIYDDAVAAFRKVA